jgi:hypothetical protein
LTGNTVVAILYAMPGVSSDRVHLERFILHKGGKTIEEIATVEKVRPETIRNSIRRVEIAQGYHTQDYLSQGLIAVVLEAAPAAQKAILSALDAHFVREKKNDKGETIKVVEPDHDTQLKAVSELRELAKAAQPKQAAKIAMGVNVNVPGAQAASGSYVGMEDRMRDIRHKRATQPVLEANVIQTAVLSPDDGEDANE